MDGILGNRYRIIRQLGKGGSGLVYLCRDDKLQKDWAVKEIDEPADLERSMELELLKTISCSVFPRIVDVVKEAGHVFLVMDYVEGITLKDRMQKQTPTEKEVRGWALEIAKGIRYLHGMAIPILYMDCKPDNILLTEGGEIRMVDLGSTYICFKDKKQRISGTKYFAPKEQRTYGREIGLPDVRTDIYAFGMTLYYLLSGGKKEQRRGGRLCIKDVNPTVSWGMSHIIEKCTMENPQQRYQSMEEVEEQLQHIRKIGRQEESKVKLLQCAIHTGRVLSSFFVLFSAYCYQRYRVQYSLYMICIWMLVFLLLCRTKTRVIYELKRNVFCGTGKKFLYIFVVVCSLSAMLYFPAYAAGKYTNTDENGLLKNYKEEGLNDKNLQVGLFDCQGRKILIRDGARWNVESDMFISVPVDELESGNGTIWVIYVSEKNDMSKRCSVEVVKDK